jgi:hypothetical protein
MLPTIVLLPALALGEPPAQALPIEREMPESTDETVLMGGMGSATGERVGGLALSLSMLHRIYFVELGAELYGATALAGRMGSFGGLLGWHVGADFSLRALVAGGVHGYEAIGSGFLSDDPGVDGSSPYVGGRVVLGYSFGRFFLGVVGMLDEDLHRQTKSVSYRSRHVLFGVQPTEHHSEHTIGQTTFGMLFVFGCEFDLTRY